MIPIWFNNDSCFTYRQSSKENALVVLMIIRIVAQCIHGIQSVLGKQIVEACSVVLLTDSLDWILNRERGGNARLVAVAADQVITADVVW